MRVVGETQAESGKDETEEEESTKGDCCESKLTSRRMQACQDNGQDEGVSERFEVSVTARQKAAILNKYTPCLIRSEDPDNWTSDGECFEEPGALTESCNISLHRALRKQS
jgi:hypothetical protein